MYAKLPLKPLLVKSFKTRPMRKAKGLKGIIDLRQWRSSSLTWKRVSRVCVDVREIPSMSMFSSTKHVVVETNKNIFCSTELFVSKIPKRETTFRTECWAILDASLCRGKGYGVVVSRFFQPASHCYASIKSGKLLLAWLRLMQPNRFESSDVSSCTIEFKYLRAFDFCKTFNHAMKTWLMLSIKQRSSKVVGGNESFIHSASHSESIFVSCWLQQKSNIQIMRPDVCSNKRFSFQFNVCLFPAADHKLSALLIMVTTLSNQFQLFLI